ncbi:unnamed protein product [Linum tenue]|uniref:Glutathione S-transferase n=1 Tax=Linum tenue TaxID=586396 RepID=A0AAV0IVC7_9ROSI|nr:unnamed protein product [Linum tenue]
MAEEENRVILHGFWGSPFVKRVEMALKLKGIPYEYVEEDLRNKSPALLTHNPVTKKVPVLIHNGKPVSESLVIIEYIDEAWKTTGPRLLPDDPYKRARVRFWADFLHRQVMEAMLVILKTDGEAQEKAVKELEEKLVVLEGGLKEEGVFGDNGGISAGMLEIVMCWCFGAYDLGEEVLGVKIVDWEKKAPLVYSWLQGIREIPVVQEIAPPKEKMVATLRFIRQSALKASNPTVPSS